MPPCQHWPPLLPRQSQSAGSLLPSVVQGGQTPLQQLDWQWQAMEPIPPRMFALLHCQVNQSFLAVLATLARNPPLPPLLHRWHPRCFVYWKTSLLSLLRFDLSSQASCFQPDRQKECWQSAPDHLGSDSASPFSA